MWEKIKILIIIMGCILQLTGCGLGSSPTSSSSQKNNLDDEQADTQFIFVEEEMEGQAEIFEDFLSLEGKIRWVAIDSDKIISLCISNISNENFRSYVTNLCDKGFIIKANDEERIDDGSYLSSNMLLLNGDVSINLTFVKDNLIIYFSL